MFCGLPISVAAEMLHSWGFPPEIGETLRRQFDSHGEPGLTRMTSLLYAARWVRAAVCGEDRAAVAPSPGVLSFLRLRSIHLLMVAKEVGARLDALDTMLAERGPEPRGFLRIAEHGQLASPAFEPRAWRSASPWMPLPAVG